MHPRNESDNDMGDIRRRKELRPPPEKPLAIQVQNESVKYSQVLVDEKIQEEQIAFRPKVTVSEYPEDTQKHKGADNVEEILNTDPVQMVQPVKTPPVLATTLPAWLKRKMGVPSIASSTKDVGLEARSYDFTEKKWLGTPPPAFSPPGLMRTVKHTPVKSLNFIDRFFNWLNALLK